MIKRADGRWQQAVTVNINGTRKVKTFYGKTKAEVNRKMAEWKEEEQKTSHRYITYGQIAADWWEEAEPNYSPSSRSTYKAAMRRSVEVFGSRDPESIRPCEISDYISAFIRRVHPSDKTARTQLMTINLIFRYAISRGYIDRSPTSDLSIPKGLPKQKRTSASPEDIQAVKDHTDAPFGMFAYWCLYTGLRRGELLALRWEDVNMVTGTINVHGSVYTYNGKAYEKPPKTAAGYRTLPIFKKLMDKLVPGTGLIFPNARGTIMTDTEFNCRWRHYTEVSGVTCTPHHLRHAYATILFENNISEKDAQYLLGHSLISVTMDIYTDIREAHMAEVRKSLVNADIG